MTAALAYRVEIGRQTASSDADRNERQLLSLLVRLGMDGASGVCELRFGDPEAPAPQAGDPLRVELDAGDGLQQVFTGTVDTVRIETTGQHVTAYDDLHKLACLETEASYENVDVDFVIKDVLQRAGVTAGRVTKGFNLPTYLLTRRPGALRQVLELADWCGADLFGDSEGKAHFVTPAEPGAAHAFDFATNVLQIEIQATPPIHDSVEVFGEGAAGSQGADKFCWLASDLAGVSGQAAIDAQGAVAVGRTGKTPRRLTLGAVRSGEAAQHVAEAQMRVLAARWLRGRIEVLGRPGVQPGDRVRLVGVPPRHAAAGLLLGPCSLRVRQVSHFLGRRRGFVTRMEF
ncbi:MAG: Phage protein D [Candidatus Accumulibacter phosphatis]|uniref:Phage protein D n=1 Tax=Candidatus Accumulibacter phosphatis TaxID=327160 RepID=A0A080LRX7_9PROT|nr:hypothetical protein [Accumulibacter sp.]KFB71052.1 MAG: Phage protein D [Candidatus Accumulibacter phosphatis]HRF10617.1 hypothetical protein [Candidatus Accumulibacter phosphatis]